MKNLHILPTDKPSRLVKFFTNKLHLCKEILPIQDEEQYQNIYITSDEEIKQGDWCIYKTGEIIHYLVKLNIDNLKKIILTTDPDLIKDGVQAIDDEFLEWFVKNPSCEEVEVELIDTFKKTNEVYVDAITSGNYYEIIKKYKIIIPKEEPKQETLEEAAERYWAKQPYNEDAFMEGAKWQEERMYSEEDMAESFMACWKANVPEGFECKLSFKEWFEQFKNK